MANPLKTRQAVELSEDQAAVAEWIYQKLPSAMDDELLAMARVN